MNSPKSDADGFHTPIGLGALAVPGGSPGSVAHTGAGPATVKYTPMPRAVASRTIASYGAQPAAG